MAVVFEFVASTGVPVRVHDDYYRGESADEIKRREDQFYAACGHILRGDWRKSADDKKGAK